MQPDHPEIPAISTRAKLSASQIAFMAILLVASIWLASRASGVNVAWACWKKEWPHLQVCDEVDGRSIEERASRLTARLARNPGDSDALIGLTLIAHQPDSPVSLDQHTLLQKVQRAAPQQIDVLRLQAYSAVKSQRWTDSLDPLIRLSQYHNDANATRTLTEMIDLARFDGVVGQALVASAKADAGWLDRVLRALPQSGVATVTAMPLIQVLVDQRRLPPKLGIALIRQLKDEGQWLDAHALWMHLWNKPLPLLFNGNFETPFVTGGFDWEAAATSERVGPMVTLVESKGHGKVLRVNLRSRPLLGGVVRQVLVLAPGRYRFSGQYQSKDLRSTHGLAWVFACAGHKQELARTPPLLSTGGLWKTMDASLEVPAACGFGVSLTLQPQADFESRTGMDGEMLFDELQLSMETRSP